MKYSAEVGNKLEVIGDNLLPAIAYGDAAGLPYETKPPQSTGSVHGLEEIPESHYLGPRPAGTWSDDTHLSLATALSLINSRGFNLAGQAESHIIALEHVEGSTRNPDYISPIMTAEDKTGWGQSSIKSVNRLRSGVNTAESGEIGASSNGVLMKMAPLVYWQVASARPFHEVNVQTVRFTRMTHNSEEAVICSLVHRQMLGRLMTMNPTDFNPLEFYSQALQIAVDYEKKYTPLGVDPEKHESPNSTAKVLRGIIFNVKNENLKAEHIIKNAPKRGFNVSETLMMAYGSFVLNQKFPECVYRTVELGGDADSTASIVSTMALCLSGEFKKPHDYDQLYDIERLERVSSQLVTCAFSR